MYKISVIVPIYNTEKFIERCVRSLFEQTLLDIEYIFVDDHSTDNSIEILKHVIDNYPDRKSHTKIISHDRNLGTLCTKLDGLRLATGEYFIVCDSDDWVDENAYQTLYDKAVETGADIVIGDYLKEYINSSKYCSHSPGNYTNGIDIIKNSYLTGFEWQVCTGIFKNQQNILSTIDRIEGLCMWDDVYASIGLFYYASKVVHISKAFYHYDRTVHGSVSEELANRRWRDQEKVVQKLQGLLNHECVLTLRWLELDTVIPYMIRTNQLDWIDMFPGCEKYISQMKQWPFYWRWAFISLSHGHKLPYRMLKKNLQVYKQIRGTYEQKI